MASISIEEIQSILAARGCKDALPHQNDSEGFFLEINFEKNQNHLILLMMNTKIKYYLWTQIMVLSLLYLMNLVF